MLPLYTQIAFWSIPTFRLTVALAIIASVALGICRLRPRGRVMDAYLVALILGLIGARLAHVALNWDYFADNTAEIFQIGAGGLDWHGAIFGGLLGLALVAAIQSRWFSGEPESNRPAFNRLLLSLTPALPLIGLGGWMGCLAAGCGYGKEVDSLANYPAWAASELADVFGIVAPRYNTPYFGLLLCLLGLLFVLLLKRRTLEQFWWLLALLSFGMFFIGFFRADHVLTAFGLRGDQILDVLVCVWSMVCAFRLRGVSHEQAP